MKTKQIDDVTYYINYQGMTMFSLHRLDESLAEMWGVTAMFPTAAYGTWKFFERADAEAWIQDQMDLDTLNITRRRQEIVNPKQSIEDVFEYFVKIIAEVNGIPYDKN